MSSVSICVICGLPAMVRRSGPSGQEALRKADDLEAQYWIEYGDENVDGLIALFDGNHTGNAGGVKLSG